MHLHPGQINLRELCTLQPFLLITQCVLANVCWRQTATLTTDYYVIWHIHTWWQEKWRIPIFIMVDQSPIMILKMSSGCCSTERYWRRIRFNLYQTIICLNIIVSIKSLLFIGLHCTCVHATDFMEKDKDSHFAQFTIWLVSLFPGVGIATEPWCGWPHLHKTARAHLFRCICDVRQAPNLLLLTSTHHR